MLHKKSSEIPPPFRVTLSGCPTVEKRGNLKVTSGGNPMKAATALVAAFITKEMSVTLSDHKPNQTCQGLGRRAQSKSAPFSRREFHPKLAKMTDKRIFESVERSSRSPGIGDRGVGKIQWDGKTAGGHPAASGAYFAVVEEFDVGTERKDDRLVAYHPCLGPRQGPSSRNKSVVLLFLQGHPSPHRILRPQNVRPCGRPQHQRGNPHHHSGAHFRFHLSQVGQDDGQAGHRSFLPVEKRGSYLFESHQRRQSDESRHQCGGDPDRGRLRQEIGHAQQLPGPPRGHRREPQARSNFETGALPGLTDPGTLGSTYSPSTRPAEAPPRKRTEPGAIAPDRLADRKGLLGGLDGIKRADADGSLEGADYFCQQAFGVVTKGISSAFGWLNKTKTPRPSPSTTPARFSTPASYSVGATCAASPTCSVCKCSWPAGCASRAVPSSPFRIADGTTTPTTTAPRAWPGSSMGLQVDHAVAAFVQDLHDRGLNEPSSSS